MNIKGLITAFFEISPAITWIYYAISSLSTGVINISHF